jgi:hypothetical protein
VASRPHRSCASSLEGERDHDPLALELAHEILECIPRRGVGPLHVLEQEQQGALLRGEAKEIRELLEQPRLAAAAHLGRGAFERGVQRRQLAPDAGRLYGQAADSAQHFRPERVGVGKEVLVTSADDERPTTEADLWLQRANQCGRADAALADYGDDAPDAAHHVVEVVRESGEVLGAPDESAKVEPIEGRASRDEVPVGADLASGRTRSVEQRIGTLATIDGG